MAMPETDTLTAHGKTWPLIRTPEIDREGREVEVLRLNPQDRIEKHRLDQEAADRDLFGDQREVE